MFDKTCLMMFCINQKEDRQSYRARKKKFLGNSGIKREQLKLDFLFSYSTEFRT